MKKELLDILRCPVDKGILQLKNETYQKKEIFSGQLICHNCSFEYNIVNYIPVMLQSTHQFQDIKSVDQWGFQWQKPEFKKNSLYYSDEILDIEYKEWNLPKNWLEGKTILEAGCGNGRNTRILCRYNYKQCIAFDLSEAVYSMLDKPEFENVHLIRADMMNPPFETDYFDFVLARQVLQHTKNPGYVIKKLSKFLKKGGYFVGSLYKTPDRPFTYLKLKIIEVLRMILKIFPKRFIYYFTWLSIPLYKYKILYPLARILFLQWKHDKSDSFTWNLNHDQYIAGYQYTFTTKKTKQFFYDAGLDNLIESKEWENLFRAEKKI